MRLVAAGVCELALRQRGSRRPRDRGRRRGRRRASAPSSNASRTGRATGEGGHPEERRARANRGRCGRPGRRRDGGRLHELGRELRDPLHPGDRGRGASGCAGSRSPSSPTTSPGWRASARPCRRPIAAGEHEATRYGFRELVDGGRRRRAPARRQPPRRDHRGPARVGARRDLRPRRGSPPRLRPQRPAGDREPRDAAPRVHASTGDTRRGRRGSDLLGCLPGRAARRGRHGDAVGAARASASTSITPC